MSPRLVIVIGSRADQQEGLKRNEAIVVLAPLHLTSSTQAHSHDIHVDYKYYNLVVELGTIAVLASFPLGARRQVYGI